MSFFDDIIHRMMMACNVKTAVELAEFIGKSQSSISKWRSRGKVPEGVVAMVATMTGVKIEWLLTGKGEMRPTGKGDADYLDPDLARIVMAEIKGRQDKEPLKLTAREAALLEMIRDLPETEQKQIEYEIMTAWVASRRKGK